MKQPPDPQRLHVAHHELGHYTTWYALGFNIVEIRVQGHGEDTDGYVSLGRPRLATPERVRAYLVGLLAGRESDLRYCTQTGAKFREYHSSSDLRVFRRLHRHRWARDTTASELRAEACAAVRGNWDRIERLAVRLAERGTL